MKTLPRQPLFSLPARALRVPCCAFVLILITSAFAVETDPAAAGKAKEPVKIMVDGREALSLSFEKLSAFPYTIVDSGTGASAEEIELARKKDQVPDWIRVYHNKRVSLTGYLMPLQVENGLAKKFIMMKDINTCCYGAVPNMNDYVVVSMKGDGVRPVQDVPVELVGVLRVEEKYENGYVTSLFQMDGEKFLGARK
ncbi:MAG: DUF3299 domain-containing protein [Opitutaceae bacterium]